MTFDWWQLFSAYRTFLEMLVPYLTITNIALYESDEKFADIWLLIKNTLKNWRLFDSVRDNLWRCAIVRAKRGVYKVTGMIIAAIKMQIISEIFLTIFNVKMINFDTSYSIFDSKCHPSLPLPSDLTPLKGVKFHQLFINF